MTTSVTINHVAAGSWRLRIGPTADTPEMTTWPIGSDDDTRIHFVAAELIKAIERESRHVMVTRTGPASFTVDASVRVEQEPTPGCITVTAVNP